MDLVRLLSKLNAIGGLQGAVNEAEGDKCPECGKVHEGECAVEESKKPDADKDGIPDWADKKDDKEEVDESSLSALRALAGITECGMDASPLTAMADANGMPAGVIDVQQPTSPEVNPAGDYDDATDAYPGQENGPAEVEEKARYTLTIQNGDSNLSMTTDMADEIIHIMKLAGVNKGAEITKKEAPADGEEGEKEVDEAWGNTPAATNEKEPKAYGDIRDWGMKGTANAKTRPVPAKSGDNPMSESAMFEEYKTFKAGK